MKNHQISILWVTFTILDKDLHKTTFLNMFRALMELGHKPTLIAVQSRRKSNTDNLKILSFPIRSIPVFSPIVFTFVLLSFLPFYILYSKPDYVIFEPDLHIFSSFPAIIISKLSKVRLILDVRSTPVEVIGSRGIMRRLCFSFSIHLAKRFFNGITTITSYMKKEICESYFLDPEKVGVWTSGVSISIFCPDSPVFKTKELRSNLGLNSKFVVLYHGVFSSTRGLTEALNAIKILRSRYPDVVLFLLGTGPLVNSLKKMVQTDGLQENVIIHDPVESQEVPKFVNMCDLCIVPLPNHPYWRHQSPLKLMECLAMGKVVILTDILAHRAVVGDAKCGIYIPSVNPSEIADAISYAYNNQNNFDEWGKIGCKIVEQKYTWLSVAKDLENYLLTIE